MAIDKITTASIEDANITTAKLAYEAAPFRNIIINGDMSIAQRATSVTGVGNGDNSCQTVDRLSFYEEGGTSGEFTMSQENDVPTGQGFAKSTKLDCTTADASLAAAEVIALEYKFEGQMLQYLKKGTSNAESLTLSFWVKTNKTGTYVANFYDNDNDRHTSQNYTVSSSNTWEKKTITFAPDTSGALTNDNTLALAMYFILGAGTTYTSGSAATAWETFTGNADNWCGGQNVNLLDNTSNEFYITGIQLEARTTASDFEFLPVDVNLQRCQRYYHQIYSQSGTQAFSSTLDMANCTDYDGGQLFCMKDLPTTMRAIPSIVQTTGTDYLLALRNGAQDSFNGFNGTGSCGYNNIAIFTSGGEGYVGATGVSARVRCNASYKLAASAEL